MASAIYRPLDRSTREIRLAHLAPSPNLEEQPSCTLHIVSLDESTYFEGLSYVCGDPTITAPIQLRAPPRRTTDDAEQFPALSGLVEYEDRNTQWPVTTNLEAALRYLRHESEVRILWIDAICIDQSNIEERNHQVPLMKAIYSNAVLVCIWLGSPSPGSDDAMAILKQLGQGTLLSKIRLGDRRLENDDLESVIQVMRRPWWTRTWVRQELILAKRASLHCGSSSLEWTELPGSPERNALAEKFRTAVTLNQFTPETLYFLLDHFSSLVQLETLKLTFLTQEFKSTESDVSFILALGRLCSKSDDRDSIYGFLGLMSERVAHQIKPDYNMSTSEVFQDAAVHLMACSNSLTFLSLTTYTAKHGRPLPTWVPSWLSLDELETRRWIATVEGLHFHNIFSACAGNAIVSKVVHRNILHLSGVHLDPILSNGVGGVMAAAPTISEILKVQREWRLLARIDMPDCSSYVAGGEAIEAFWRVLVSDYHWEMSGIQRRCESRDYKAYRNWKRDLEAIGEVWTSDLAAVYYASFRRTCSGRRFFITKKGYFGMGPAELSEGDQVYILAGGKVPLVLRPVSGSQPDTFELVGDCYIHGVMDGEAVIEHPMYSGKNPWKKAVATAKSIVPLRSKSLDPDLPLRDFHDVFIV
ncbi:Heterokaryon incompatibility protein (HET) domain containing protein [Hyaloscypha variabilis]|jgi:hypothetical protein